MSSRDSLFWRYRTARGAEETLAKEITNNRGSILIEPRGDGIVMFKGNTSGFYLTEEEADWLIVELKRIFG